MVVQTFNIHFPVYIGSGQMLGVELTMLVKSMRFHGSIFTGSYPYLQAFVHVERVAGGEGVIDD